MKSLSNPLAMVAWLIAVSLLAFGPTAAGAGIPRQDPAEDSLAEAAPSDVATIDSIIAAVYDVISGPAGEARDWNRFRSLFIDGARLIPRAPNAPDGVVVWSPEDYVERAGPNLMENGFFESEISREVHPYGDIAHVFSAYESKRSASDAAPFARGINSFQLLQHDGRWWIVTIYWQSETEDYPLPERFVD